MTGKKVFKMDLDFKVLFVFIIFPWISLAQIYTFKSRTQLKNIVVHNDDIFVGAFNYIYRLNRSLAELNSVKTGPVNDSRICASSVESCLSAVPTDNRNTLLLPYKMGTETKLLTCGSIYQGVCYLRDPITLVTQSHGVRNVAANDADSPTVGFVTDLHLYVAVTHKDRLEALILPSVSIRKLDVSPLRSLLQILSDSMVEVKRSYVIDYVSGFEFNRSAFFTSVQLKRDSASYHSKIIQFCVNQGNLKTYREIPLSCKNATGADYNILISGTLLKATGKTAEILNVTSGENVYIGVFSKSLPNSKEKTKDNAVCIFSMKDVQIAYNKNIEKCVTQGLPYDGGLPWLKDYAGINKCVEAMKEYEQKRVKKDQQGKGQGCSYHSDLMEFPLGGDIPVNQRRLFALPGKPVVIRGYPHDRGLALFVGTEDGSLMKYSLSQAMTVHLYGQEIVSDGSPITSIEFDSNMVDFYTLSPFKIAKYNVIDCKKRMNCIDCLSGPYCGWCKLANKCGLRSECNFSEKPDYFVNDTSSRCPAIVAFNPQPAAISVFQQRKLVWKIDNLPKLPDEQTYTCSFGSVNVTATAFENEYSCTTPSFDEIPGTDTAKNLTLAVFLRSPEDGMILFDEEIEFFNCGKIESCTECTRFKFECNWCPHSNTCLDFDQPCKDVIPYAGPSQSMELSKCPMIKSIATRYLSSGANREIDIIGLNLGVSSRYHCEVAIDGGTVIVPAERKSDTAIKCKGTTYSYDSNEATYLAPVSILFGGKVLDQLNKIEVIFYKCHVTRDSCGICLDAPKPWNCGWCGKKSCTVADACPSDKQWANSTCPLPPAIQKFTPSSGAIYGNMVLKIEGRDLGTMSNDVNNITVAGTACHYLTELYEKSKTVYCKTGSVDKPKHGSVQMFVKFGDDLVKIDSKTLLFEYKEPMVSRFEPTKGPCSGGTDLTIFGTDLNVGNNVTVTVAGNDCNSNLRIYANRIICTITSSCPARRRRATASDSVIVFFDGVGVAPSKPTPFSVEPDPVITSVNTYSLRTADSQKLETFVSGGQVFIVKGERFDLIKNPIMKFTVYPQRAVKTGRCEMVNPERLHCIAPNITSVTGMLNNGEAVVELGFAMQRVKAVETVRNLTVKDDPVFYRFDGVLDLQQNNLYLKGKNLDLLGNEDVNVTVGGLVCVIQNIRERLFCNFPDKDQMEKMLQNKKALVKVTVGLSGLEYTPGYVRYVKNNEEKPFPWLYVYIAGAIGAVFIIVIIILGILYRRRRKKEKQYQKVNQTKLENLESMYARECKEAFAELQIEMTDLTTDMSTASIPYLKFQTYAMRLLFPTSESHPVIDKDCNKSDTWKKCMASLCELLKEREFLLIFIKTLEGQSTFAMRDRCKFASLLIVALQDDIKYVTDILQDLLSDLVQKSVESGRTKLLLRRTESVAEKLLTNWLSYTLYEFLQNRVGEPLFRLFSALVTLLDKEPVDAISCEARNSLSEDRLLRHKVDFKVITAHVEYDGGDMIQVQLLDCDSIDQAKEKILKTIYKHVPFSERPSKDALVLVYQTSTGGEKILHQEDSTCEIEGEWKRINTLGHFLIPDGCQLKLMPFSVYSDGTGTPGRLEVFHDTSLSNVNFAPTHSSTPMLNNHYYDNGGSLKRWHLVKTSDYPIEQKGDVRQNKMMAEIYLTRLLKTKGTLQNFVNDLFEAVFAKEESVPPAIKFLFDFLDKQAALLNITENEVLHTWKNNCLPLKFWINVIKNPNFVFDINKTSIVDSCLSVIAQLFMDACSPEEHRLGKDSPSNKLLYAKEIPEYKKKVAKFYSEVKMLPPATDKELNESFSRVSEKYGKTFNHYNAATEIFSYAVKYKVKIVDALEAADLEEYASKLQDLLADLPDD